VEAAINITSLLAQTGDACAGLSIKTLWIKTKASASSTAALKDFVNPIPVSFTFGSASISYNGPFCPTGTASVTQTGATGGTYTASPAGLTINSSTGEINLATSTPGTYTVTYTFVTNGCTKTTTATVVINANPSVTVNSPSRCSNGPAATITATPNPAGTYTYAWTVPAGASNPGNVASFSATVAGTYSVTVTNGANCSGSGSGTLTVNSAPTITSPGIGAICVGISSASLTYSGVTGGANQYRIDWNSGAEAAGLVDVALTSLPASPISITGTGSLAAGTYSGTIYVKNSTTSCESAGDAVSLTVNANPTASAGTAPAAQCRDAVNGNTFSLNGSGTNGTASWAVQSNPNGLTVQITNGTTFTPSVKVSGGFGTVTLRLTVTSNATPSCGSATSDVTITVDQNPAGPAVTYNAPACDEATFSVTINSVVAGTSYSIVDKNGNPIPGVSPASPHVASAADAANGFSFSNIPAGSGFQVTATVGNCTSNATTCGVASLARTSQRVQRIDASIESQATSVIAAPNPFNDRIRFSLKSTVSGQGSLELYNMLGQKVKTVFQGQVEKGKVQTIEYSVPGSQRQNLIYVFRVGDQKASGKLIGLK